MIDPHEYRKRETKLLELCNTDMTRAEMGEVIGRSASTVSKMLSGLDIIDRRAVQAVKVQKISPDKYPELIEMFNAEATYKEMAKHFNVSGFAINGALRKCGVKMRGKGYRRPK